MIRVLVVEDEQPILRSICQMIENTNDNFKIVGKASNGNEALEIMQKENIHVIFLDINMPILDGIEVLKKMKEYNMDVLPIILSGYQDFNYARSALQYGAVEYLLKPLKRKELQKTLLLVIDLLAEKRKSNVQKYLQGDSRNDIESENISVEYTYLASVHIGTYQSRDWTNCQNQVVIEVQHELEKSLIQELGIHKFWLAKRNELGEYILFIQPDVENVEQYLREIVDGMKNSVLPVTILLQVKKIAVTFVRETYGVLRKQIKNYITFEESNFNIVKSYKEIKEKQVQNEKNHIELNQITMTTRTKELSAICKATLEDANGRQILVEKGLKHLTHKIYEKIPAMLDYFTIEERVLESIENSNSIKEVQEKYMNILITCFLFTNSNHDSREQLTCDIKQYIDKNYAFKLSGQFLAEQFGFVPLYLRELFKKYYGMSPNEYITQVRIEKAKELLRTGKSVKGAAIEVGYEDPLYFSKRFKKREGITPTEYVQKYFV